ncbi:MAG: DUF1232 domain-containing protein [Akkermansia sp.]|nr:DUF1232 domain-containing protein [Akkermansia sp.]
MIKALLHKTQHVAINLLSDTVIGRAALRKAVSIASDKIGCPLTLEPATADRKLWNLSMGGTDADLHVQATITSERLEELLTLILDAWVDKRPLSADELHPIILQSLQPKLAPTEPRTQEPPAAEAEEAPPPPTIKDKIFKTLADFEQSEWVQRMKQPENRQVIIATAEKWLRSAGKKSPVFKRVNLIYNMLRHGKADAILTPRNIAILAAVLLYTISPLDCIPDIIPVIGWMDDMGLLAMAIAAITPLFLQKKEDIPAEMQEELTNELSTITQEQKDEAIDV